MAQQTSNPALAKNWTADLIEELKRVTWPSRQDTIRLTAIVITISLLIGLYIGIIDILLAKLLELFTKVR
ncbi:preprotein translocase subunit SecE [Candidatus Roizmanbacteria bacterium]|nr:preprotein translocase subunit SecE [Candidatus Roizmanbacteria bacterium]